MGGYAWVTLATNDSYSLGALVLAHSLKQAATQQQLAVLITPGVTNSMRKKLAEIFNVVKEVNILDSKDEANLRLLKRPELGITFTKLHCWRLTQFEKCVFLDADTLVLENCDELFEREELSAAPDIGWPDCFNSGVFVYRPSNETYEKLINFALEKGSFDGGDQGLLNLYFSDWAHKDISKHLPFIYNMASTACYSYLPAFKQYGKNAKILHFIGSSKPWLQYFNTETRKVHPSEGLQHLEQILQHWWNIFCNLIHPALSPDMTSHTDTVHGSQSYTSQSISHTSYYHNYEHNPSSQIPETAEDYQNVWDPWEEYDSRQSGNKPPDSTGHDHPTISEQSPSSQSHYEHYHQSSEMHVDSHTHTEHSEPQSNYFEHKSSHVENRAPESHCEHSQIENNSPHNQHFENHNQYHDHFDSAVSENQHFEQKGLDNKNVHNDEPGHNVVMRQNSHNQHQQNLIESHNTNTFSNADHHVHIHHPSVPTYISQPQIPIIQHQPPETPNQDCSSYNTPPDDPRLPDECVATTTVSNAITLKSDSNEDTNQNQAGLAGAFAKLTLGEARTPEQQALDDHLRRQGWEVGNIDYLGRDSFDNIWSKICETLSITAEAESTPSIVENITEPSTQKEASPEKLPEPSTQKETSPEKVETVELLQTSPLPEPDKTESTTDRSPVESKKKIKLEVTSETSTAIQSSDSYAKETKSVAVAPLSPEIKPLPTPVPDASAQPPKADNVAKIAQSGIVESSPGEQSTPETKETPPTILESPKANYCKTEISTVTQSPVTTSSEVQSVAEPPKAQEVVIPQESSKAAEVPKDVPDKSAQSVSAQPPLTTPAEPSKTVLQAVPKEILVESPKATPIETPKAAPTESSKISPTGTAEDESNSKTTPLKTTPAEPPKTTPAEAPKTTPAEAPKTTAAEAPKTTPTEAPKVTPAELPKTISAEKPKTDTVSAAPVESPKAVAAGMPKSEPTETPKAVVPEASEGISEESPKSEPVEMPKTPEETSKDASAAIAITSTTKNVKTSKITPAESPKVLPVETIKAEPVETKEVSKKGSKGKQTPETKEVPKKVTSKEAAQVPVSKVIEPTPPTTPGSPQTPQTTEPLSPVAIAGLKIEGSVPNTPPPQETASVPTPPPRKSAGAPKKAAAKKK